MLIQFRCLFKIHSLYPFIFSNKTWDSHQKWQVGEARQIQSPKSPSFRQQHPLQYALRHLKQVSFHLQLRYTLAQKHHFSRTSPEWSCLTSQGPNLGSRRVSCVGIHSQSHSPGSRCQWRSCQGCRWVHGFPPWQLCPPSGIKMRAAGACLCSRQWKELWRDASSAASKVDWTANVGTWIWSR